MFSSTILAVCHINPSPQISPLLPLHLTTNIPFIFCTPSPHTLMPISSLMLCNPVSSANLCLPHFRNVLSLNRLHPPLFTTHFLNVLSLNPVSSTHLCLPHTSLMSSHSTVSSTHLCLPHTSLMSSHSTLSPSSTFV